MGLTPLPQEARLGGPTPPKELGKIYASILELLCGQLDVLRPSGGAVPPPQAPELVAALRALEDLQAALAARLQVTLATVALGLLGCWECLANACSFQPGRACCRHCCCNHRCWSSVLLPAVLTRCKPSSWERASSLRLVLAITAAGGAGAAQAQAERGAAGGRGGGGAPEGGCRQRGEGSGNSACQATTVETQAHLQSGTGARRTALL